MPRRPRGLRFLAPDTDMSKPKGSLFAMVSPVVPDSDARV
jgi:hypothetical protein